MARSLKLNYAASCPLLNIKGLYDCWTLIVALIVPATLQDAAGFTFRRHGWQVIVDVLDDGSNEV